jgi:hypothetical protein
MYVIIFINLKNIFLRGLQGGPLGDPSRQVKIQQDAKLQSVYSVGTRQGTDIV